MRLAQTLANVVIVDGPAVKVANTAALAREIIGAVMIVQPGHTLVDAAETRIEQFERIGARMVGVMFNRIPPCILEALLSFRNWSPNLPRWQSCNKYR